MIDQQVMRHFLQCGECLSNPPFFLNLRISAYQYHDVGLGFYAIGESLYSLIFLQCIISFMFRSSSGNMCALFTLEYAILVTSYIFQEQLRKHVRFVHLGIRYPCNLCDYVAYKPFTLKRHKQSRHKEDSSSLCFIFCIGVCVCVCVCSQIIYSAHQGCHLIEESCKLNFFLYWFCRLVNGFFSKLLPIQLLLFQLLQEQLFSLFYALKSLSKK